MGPTIVQQIREIFEGGQLTDSWTKSNLVLIPKVDHPSKPTQFRPLSVCSIYYRILMKLIANRIKPLLPKLVSHNQSAFLKGRSIQDNVLLMKEVMHSFRDSGYTEPAFVLKAIYLRLSTV
jgi:Reverse transcriptase (RNA-dependent DNA polymerase)